MDQPKLPSEITKAKPRYRDKELYWQSDVDKSCYIVANSKTQSKRHTDYLNWVTQTTGWNEEEVRAHGNKIKESLKELYKKSESKGEFWIDVPVFYKPGEIPKKSEEVDEEPWEPELPYGGPITEAMIDAALALPDPVVSPKPQTLPKRPRAKVGELTKAQETILNNILSDLIEIKVSLINIKKNQEDKIEYEKKRDRLQAERMAFLEKEKLLEKPSDLEGKGAKKSDDVSKEKKKKKSSLLDSLIEFAIASGIGSVLFSGGGKTPSATSPTNTSSLSSPLKPPTPSQTPTITPQKFAEGGVIGPSFMLPFADGGELTPIEGKGGPTAIQPLETATKSNKATSGETTYSRGFSLDDLKSPLAEIMKLPLKVAGAAVLSAVSRLASQFDISDSSIESDLSKMIGDLSKAFGLPTSTITSKPAKGGLDVTKRNNDNDVTVNVDQKKYASTINAVADSLKPEASDASSPPEPPAPPPTPPAPSTPSGQGGSTPTPPPTTAAPSGQGGSTPTPPPTTAAPSGQGGAVGAEQATHSGQGGPSLDAQNKFESLNSTTSNSFSRSSSLMNLDLSSTDKSNSSSNYSSSNNTTNQSVSFNPVSNNITRMTGLNPIDSQYYGNEGEPQTITLPPQTINSANNDYVEQTIIALAKPPGSGDNYFIRNQILGSV